MDLVLKAIEILLVAAGLMFFAAGVANRIALSPRRRWRREYALDLEHRAELRRIEIEILRNETAPARLTP